jgi:hypothetical protein
MSTTQQRLRSVGAKPGSAEPRPAPPTYLFNVAPPHWSSMSVLGECSFNAGRAALGHTYNYKRGAPKEDTPQIALSQVPLLLSP